MTNLMGKDGNTISFKLFRLLWQGRGTVKLCSVCASMTSRRMSTQAPKSTANVTVSAAASMQRNAEVTPRTSRHSPTQH